MEEALFRWFLQARQQNQIVTSRLIMTKARNFASLLGVGEEFKFSKTWVRNFKKRYNVRKLKICGEKLSSDRGSIAPFKERFFQHLKTHSLNAHQIYNADETALFYKMLYGYTLVHPKEVSAPGYKTAKDRVTFMPCANTSGAHKLPLLMIGKSKNPRAFKNKEIPVQYASSSNAWMTREIFKKWFHDTFVPEVRRYMNEHNLEGKALLILDNCSAHHFRDKLMSDDEAIQVMFLPPNVTSVIQPMDQNAIQTVKVKYREKLHLELSNEINMTKRMKEVNLKDVAYWLHEAWAEVTPEVLQASWKGIGFVIDDKLLDEDDVPLSKLFQRNVIQNTTLPDFLEEAASVKAYSDAEIIATLRAELPNQESDEGEDSEDGLNNSRETSFEMQRLFSCATHNQAVADALKLAIEWAEDNIGLTDVLHLRRIRNTVLERSLIDK